MRIPVLCGTIDRRILANYRIDPAIVKSILPAPFRPKIINGFAVGGICLIRLKSLRPRFVPFSLGGNSENAAHRFAVEWDVDGKVLEGVYIPRRDTNSLLNTLVGGRIFPGVHHRAAFVVNETNGSISVELSSDDDDTHVSILGTVTESFPSDSVFSSFLVASEFFRRGALGYSATNVNGEYDGLELRCRDWRMEILRVERIESSYFDNISRFPKGGIQFDCALLMRGIMHEWHSREGICCSET